MTYKFILFLIIRFGVSSKSPLLLEDTILFLSGVIYSFPFHLGDVYYLLILVFVLHINLNIQQIYKLL